MSGLQFDPGTTKQLLGVVADVLLAIRDPGILHHVAIIGGLVPTLMAGEGITPATGPHQGTGDVDLHLALELLEGHTGEYYGNVVAALESLELAPAEDDGRDRRWRWQGRYRGVFLTVELLSATRAASAGRPQALPVPGTRAQESVGDPEMVRTLGLDFGHLVHVDRAEATRTVDSRDGTIPDFQFPIAGLASWLALKADAIDKRDKAKDAYDVVWLLECLGPDVAAERVAASELWSTDDADDLQGQMARLEAQFREPDHVGPGRYIRFLLDMEYAPLVNEEAPEARLRRDAVEVVTRFLRGVHDRRQA